MKELEKIIYDYANKYHDKDDWDVPIDYFSWSRDSRYGTYEAQGSYLLPQPKLTVDEIIQQYQTKFSKCEDSYLLLSDDWSRKLFSEYIYLKIVGEARMRLSSFDNDFIKSYERNAQKLHNAATKAHEPLLDTRIYQGRLEEYKVNVFSTVEDYNCMMLGRKYGYQQGDVTIAATPGDVVIDAGVAIGDTVAYFASTVSQKKNGMVYCFDIYQENMQYLEMQIEQNKHLKNFISFTQRGIWNEDNKTFSASAPSTSSTIANLSLDSLALNYPQIFTLKGMISILKEKGLVWVVTKAIKLLLAILKPKQKQYKFQTITIDTFAQEQNLSKVDMIKMDIEGAEVPALEGARKIIEKYKPKLAICVYHKDSDLWLIPQLIKEIRDDYEFYLDCTTGFGGETVLYCR
ncbi:MAG: FkbM family methyltransferase [Alphaproteobacteria bacterium]|nr:FkbM family methyltransferase [Alphaproteobacteria bacterium]